MAHAATVLTAAGWSNVCITPAASRVQHDKFSFHPGDMYIELKMDCASLLLMAV